VENEKPTDGSLPLFYKTFVAYAIKRNLKIIVHK